VSGSGGETKTMSFEAPPPRPPVDPIRPTTDDGTTPIGSGNTAVDDSGKPLPPVVTYVGLGLTGVLLVASIVSTASMLSGVKPYEKAADEYTMCTETMEPTSDECTMRWEKAHKLLKSGESKETLTTALWVGTGVVGVATAVIALTLTEWPDDEESDDEEAFSKAPRLGLAASSDGALISLKGRF